MQALGIEPVVLDGDATNNAAAAFLALASAARAYLGHLDRGVATGTLAGHVGLHTRIRGTGPGVSFGSVVAALETAAPQWVSPFEGCSTASGAVVRGSELIGPQRDDAFLLLRFAPGTLDLPLHVHDDSDRFIIVIGGRGFFHISPDPLEAGPSRRIRHIAVRERDTLMFRRGTVHTFSAPSERLVLLSYHHPYVPLEDERQYRATVPPELPAHFLGRTHAQVSFDPAWSVVP